LNDTSRVSPTGKRSASPSEIQDLYDESFRTGASRYRTTGTARANPTSPFSATPALSSNHRRETIAGPSRSLAFSLAVPVSGPVVALFRLSLCSLTVISSAE
jgi:hypothetical protein